MPRPPLFSRTRRMAAGLAAALAFSACTPPPPLSARPAGDDFTASPLLVDGAPWAPPPVEAALDLTSAEPRFGGWSGLTVTGNTLTAVSDRGYFLRLTLDPLAPGGLGPSHPRFGILPDPQGNPLEGPLRDAEEVVALPDGAMIVSFERNHRLWLYPAAESPFSLPPRPLPPPPGIADLPYNGGIEAMALLPDGRLLILAEGEDGEGTTVGWLGTPATPAFQAIDWQPLRLTVSDGFRPTSAAVDANGDLLVLERYFSLAVGAAVRIRRIAGASIRPGATLDGPEVTRLDQAPAKDNFEGMTAVPLPSGGTRVLLISDDNYSGLQKTLLLALRL